MDIMKKNCFEMAVLILKEFKKENYQINDVVHIVDVYENLPTLDYRSDDIDEGVDILIETKHISSKNEIAKLTELGFKATS